MCEYNCSEVVKYLRSYWEGKYFFEAINEKGNTPLHIACNLSLYKCVCRNSPEYFYRDCPEHICCKNFTLSFLLESTCPGALVAKNNAGEIPLAVALQTFNDCKPASLEVLSMLSTLAKQTINNLIQKADGGKIVHLFCQYPNIYTIRFMSHLKKKAAALNYALPPKFFVLRIVMATHHFT